MLLARAAYTALAYALLPYARARLAWRARSEPGYGEHVAERFGRYDESESERDVVWVHAVSVGETRAAAPLVEALAKRYPGHRILMTHMTPTGRQTSETLFGDRVLRAYVPYDYPGAVNRFLDHFRPSFGVIMETEIWPNLLHACAARGVPVYLVNARLSERSYRAYRRVLPLVRDAIGKLAGLAAQSLPDARRFIALGMDRLKVVVSGNLKFDVTAPQEQIELGRRWRRDFRRPAGARRGQHARRGGSPAPGCVSAAGRRRARSSSSSCRGIRSASTKWRALIELRRLRFVRRSSGTAPSADTRVLLGDSMGEMMAYYASSDVAFIGGSLLPFGGQNLIEACALGKPVLIGPHTYNFEEAAAQAVEAGAALRVETADEVMRTAERLIERPETLRATAERAIAFSSVHQGATARIMAMIEP